MVIKKIKSQKYKKAELSSSFNLIKENFFKDVLKILRLGDFFILAGKEFHKVQLVYWKVLRPWLVENLGTKTEERLDLVL